RSGHRTGMHIVSWKRVGRKDVCKATATLPLPPEGSTLDKLRKAVEEIAIVLGARSRLRVILYREDRQCLMRQPLDAAIRKVDVADVKRTWGGQACRIYLEVMVLRGDRYAAGA